MRRQDPQITARESGALTETEEEPEPVAQIPVRNGLSDLTGKYPVRKDWMVVFAVRYELVSDPEYSLITGQLTGHLEKFAL